MASVSNQKPTREIDYPTGDGKPMAETELHLLDMIDIIQLLRDHFAGRPDVYVGGNLLLFYQKGNPRKHIAPDAFVVLGVPKEPPRQLPCLGRRAGASFSRRDHVQVDQAGR